MRGLLVSIVMLAIFTAAAAPAFALGASDTMSAWRGATDKERSDLLEQLLGARAAGKVLTCMNDTAKTPGHTDLPIGEVAKVCASQGNGEQPV